MPLSWPCKPWLTNWKLSEMPQTIPHPPDLSPLRCPKCRNWRPYRRGQAFDHEKLCPDCDVVWCPEDVMTARNELADSLQNQDGGGI